MNKAKEVREKLKMTPTEAGQLLFDYTPKQAYDTWSQWESGAKKPSKPTENYFNLILFLSMCKELKTPGADKALDHFISINRDLT